MHELAEDIVDTLETGQGYHLGLSFQQHELEVVRSLIKSQWLENIKRHAPEQVEKFLAIDMIQYHRLSTLINHAAIWSKINRILPQTAVDYIRSTSLIKSLEDIYGNFGIADEENIGREEMYWRLVRPNQSTDIGPLHADAWYWKLGHGKTPHHAKRVKVWIAMYCEPGLNGLRVVPSSQKKDWKYHGENRDGFVKPQIDEDEKMLPITLLHTKPGDAVVFHDKLLHGGAINKGLTTRVSLEFTLFVNL